MHARQASMSKSSRNGLEHLTDRKTTTAGAGDDENASM